MNIIKDSSKYAFLFLLVATACAPLARVGAAEKKGIVLNESRILGSAWGPAVYKPLDYSLLTFKSKRRNERFPLILVLHGTGGSGPQYLETWKSEAEIRRVMVLAPTLNTKKFDFKMLHNLIEIVANRYPIDKSRVFLAGVSSGALVARWMLVDDPKLWKGVILIASPTDEAWTAKVDVRYFPPVLFVHGENDTLFPVESIQEHADTLAKRGIQTKFLRYPYGKHEHRSEWNKDIFDWMENSNSAERK